MSYAVPGGSGGVPSPQILADASSDNIATLYSTATVALAAVLSAVLAVLLVVAVALLIQHATTKHSSSFSVASSSSHSRIYNGTLTSQDLGSVYSKSTPANTESTGTIYGAQF